MQQKHNILVFPCGSEIGLEIWRAFRGVKEVRLIGLSSVPNHGKFLYEHYLEGFPFVNSPDFLPRLKTLIDEHRIDFIFPAHDSVVLKLGEWQDELEAMVISSSSEVCRVARSKQKTYDALADVVRVPRQYTADQLDDLTYPLFLKPDIGQGSRGTQLVANAEEARFFLERAEAPLLILEYLPGEEYTIDCFSDHRDRLQFVGPRKRNRISNGISVNTFTLSNDEFLPIARKIHDRLSFDGAWFFQLKRDREGQLTLLEVAPRIAGSMALYRAQGVNFPLLSYYNKRKFDLDFESGSFEVEMDRAWSNKYRLSIEYEHLYVDYDDCMIIDGKVNDQLVQLLFQSISAGKKLHLITRHAGDLEVSLRSFRLDRLFDSVTHLKKEERKSDYVVEKSAVFIDDSHAERMDVMRTKGIPVFAVDAIEALLK